jgi:beta-N-acetylhexosaminidase
MSKLNISNLNMAQKIGQVIMPRIDFNDPNSLPLAKRLVKECEVGGFIIFNGKRDIVTETTRELQAVSEIPLLFGCDAERGLGQIVSDMTLFPFTMSLGAARDEELVYNQAHFIAHEMKECGLNLLFAPVADVNTNPDNPIINIRSYGDEYALVSRLCVAFIKGCQENGVLACAKHFPGHGRTGVD